MPFVIKLSATTKVVIANNCCSFGPLSFLPIDLPSSKPASVPMEKGAAISKSKLPATTENNVPPLATIAKTPSEVATIDLVGKTV